MLLIKFHPHKQLSLLDGLHLSQMEAAQYMTMRYREMQMVLVQALGLQLIHLQLIQEMILILLPSHAQHSPQGMLQVTSLSLEY